MPLSVNNISALNALSTKQSVTANNIANSETKEFKKSTTVLEEGLSGAVSTKIQPVNTPGTMVNQPDGSLEEMSNVDLIQETTDMITTRHAYEANLKALKININMEDAVLDLIG
ncbi:MAG: flagellar basal body protein [Desulfuromusa sp.]|jgi:flagellar basal body rod protein FlgG|nr:flagellar basal body protein [Desulfuromusa sp.]